ncbi:MAG: hypothetical protein ACHQ2E_10230 [Gemmatimonadales bacterium]
MKPTIYIPSPTLAALRSRIGTRPTWLGLPPPAAHPGPSAPSGGITVTGSPVLTLRSSGALRAPRLSGANRASGEQLALG